MMRSLRLVFLALLAIAMATPVHSQVYSTNGTFLPDVTVSQLPTASTNSGRQFHVHDGLSTTDCTVGGGTQKLNCISDGTTWLALAGGTSRVGVIVRTSTTVLTVAGGASASNAFISACGSVSTRVTTPATVTVSANGGTAIVWADCNGAISVGYGGGTFASGNVTCTGCAGTPAFGTTTYPAVSAHLGTWTAASGTWDMSGSTPDEPEVVAPPDCVGTGSASCAFNGKLYTVNVTASAAGSYQPSLTTVLDADFPTAFNNGTSFTHTDSGDGVILVTQGAMDNFKLKGQSRTVSAAADFSHIIAIRTNFDIGSTNTLDSEGVFFTDGTKAATCGWIVDGSGTVDRISGVKIATSATTWTEGSVFSLTTTFYQGMRTNNVTYFRLSWTASTTTLKCEVSKTKTGWRTAWSDTSYLTPTGIGYYMGMDFGSATANKMEIVGYD